jgi:3-oxoacyl-(acyl-carrier-protein) synthase
MRVVITGVGIVAGNALTKQEFCDALKNGKSAIKKQKWMEDVGLNCQVGGVPELSKEKILQYVNEEDLIAMNNVMVYGAIAGIDCWRDAGFTYDKDDRSSYDPYTSIILGCGMGGVETVIEKMAPRILDKKIQRVGSSYVEQSMHSNSVAKLTGLLGIGGKSTTVSSACTSGTEAIVDGYNYIKFGKSKRVLVGGVETAHPSSWGGFDAMRVINRKSNENPEKASRPLSASAAGFVPSSGAGILMLESLDSAIERGAKIYAEIIAGNVNSGGFRNGGSMTAPSSVGVQACIKSVIKESGVNPKDITVINGHLTATMADPLEVKNWAAALDLVPEEMPYIQATKSLIGHGLGAAGGFEGIACALQIKHGFVHGNLNCEDVHPEIKPWEEKILNETREMDVNIIAKSSFGFGDVNGCLVFKRYGI